MCAKKLSDVAPAPDLSAKLYSPDELEGQSMALTHFTFRKGQYGDFTIMTISNLETGEELKASTGAQIVMDQLESINTAFDLPLYFTFAKKGRSWFMDDPSDLPEELPF